MPNIRKIDKVSKSRPTLEGAGVHLKRAFGYHEAPGLDPFLLLDDFHSDNPKDYIAGFPWHPHRGIETVTYMLEGKVEHGDSIGNSGAITSGDVQWMTAGSGIIHQEMPKGDSGLMWGFQLWVNLPAADKMMVPRYQEVKSNEIPEVTVGDGIKIKVICGEVQGTKGPVQDIMVDPMYLDVTIPPDTDFEYPVKNGYKVFVYVIDGSGSFTPDSEDPIEKENLVLFGDGDLVKIKAGAKGLRFLFMSGKPIGEEVAWYGPIVMNTQKELEIAFEEYRNGTFIKQ
jgi:redox-sensitive bicupin YhaK (pirin superfamily)